jgi:TldD protein
MDDLLDFAVSLGEGTVEARAEDITTESIILENGILRSVESHVRIGIGVRVLLGGRTGYACTTRLSRERVRDSVERAARQASNGFNGSAPISVDERDPVKGRTEQCIDEATTEDRISLVTRAYESAVEHGKDASSVEASHNHTYGRRYFRSSDGSDVVWDFLTNSLFTGVTSRGSNGLAEGYDSHGGSFDISRFVGDISPEKIGERAAMHASEILMAKACPAGRFRALIDPRLAGVLAHEAFGHMCECDSVIAGESVLKGRIGERLGAEAATIIDDGSGAIAMPYDDEGTPAKRVVMLDRGVLSGYLHSRRTAHEMGTDATGNARAVSYKHEPICRMRNTYFAPGDMSENEAVRELDNGICAIGTIGGESGSDGTFLFKTMYGYMVKNGEILYPLKGAALMGNILEFFKGVEGATKKVRMEAGSCGKNGQFPLLVGMGGPHLLINDVTFGGE